jgi:GntR family transcriptional regulator
VLSSTRVTASGRLEEILGSGEFLEVRRLNLADGMPFARVTVWIPAAMAEGFSIRALEEHSFYELLSRSPLLLRPLVSARQTIGATAITEIDASLLDVPIGSPVLVCERITFDVAGHPVLFSEFVFPGSRTQFVTELTSEVGSIAPSGLRLVEEW